MDSLTRSLTPPCQVPKEVEEAIAASSEGGAASEEAAAAAANTLRFPLRFVGGWVSAMGMVGGWRWRTHPAAAAPS